MTILVYVTGNEFLTSETIRKGFATQDIVLPCSGEVIAEAGYVYSFVISRLLAQTEHMPSDCWQGIAVCAECPIYNWRRETL